MPARWTRRYWTMVSPIPWCRATRRLAHQPMLLGARQRPRRPDRDEYGRQHELPRDRLFASLPSALCALRQDRLLWIMPIAFSAECCGARQLSRRRYIRTAKQLGAMQVKCHRAPRSLTLTYRRHHRPIDSEPDMPHLHIACKERGLTSPKPTFNGAADRNRLRPHASKTHTRS